MRGLIPALVVLSLGIVRPAAADPVTLISGSMLLDKDDSSSATNVSGDRSADVGSRAEGVFGAFLGSGEAAHFSGSRSSSRAPISHDTGTIMSGNHAHATAPFIVPDPVTPSRSTNDGPAPFTLAGMVQLFSTPADTHPLFTPAVNSRGVGPVFADPPGTGMVGKDGEGLKVSAAPTASSTPEPASMLLLGTGLAAAWQFRRFRRVD